MWEATFTHTIYLQYKTIHYSNIYRFLKWKPVLCIWGKMDRTFQKVVRSNWLIRLTVALPSVVLMCIGGMLAFKTEGRTWRTMPEVIILRLPEQTTTWNLFVVWWQDHRTTLQMIADRLNIGKETVRRIVTEDLENRSARDCSSRLDHRVEIRTGCLLPGSFNGTRWTFWGNYHYRWRNMVFRLRSDQQTECRVGGAKLSKTKETAI